MLARKGLLGLFNRALVSPKNINKVNSKRKLKVHFDQSLYETDSELVKAQKWFDNTRNKIIVENEIKQAEDVKRFNMEKKKIDSLHNFMYFIVAECTPAPDCSQHILQFKRNLDLSIMINVAKIGSYDSNDWVFTTADALQDISSRLFTDDFFNRVVNQLNEFNMSDEFKMFLMRIATGERFATKELHHFKRPLNEVFPNVNPVYFIHLHFQKLNYKFKNQHFNERCAAVSEQDIKITSDFYAESLAKTESKVARSCIR